MQHHERRNLTRFEGEIFSQLTDHQRRQKECLGWPHKPDHKIKAIMGAVTGALIGLALVGLIIMMVRMMVLG